MPAAAAVSQVKTVAVIDDDPENLISTSLQVEDAGFKPVVFDRGFRDLNDLIAQVRRSAQAAVCDHKLTRIGNYAPFYGAEAVAKLYDSGIPAVLVSQYTRQEAQFGIRIWRRKVPVMLSRDELDPERIKRGLWNCMQEIRGVVPSERRLRTALVRIDDVEDGRVTAFVPQWNPSQAVYFLETEIPENLRDKLVPDQRFTAMVNIGARQGDELFFEDFKLAPGPDPSDGLS